MYLLQHESECGYNMTGHLHASAEVTERLKENFERRFGTNGLLDPQFEAIIIFSVRLHNVGRVSVRYGRKRTSK